MEGNNVFQTGAVFENDYERYKVIGTSPADNKVLVENMAGMEEWKHEHELLGVPFK